MRLAIHTNIQGGGDVAITLVQNLTLYVTQKKNPKTFQTTSISKQSIALTGHPDKMSLNLQELVLDYLPLFMS